MQQQVLQQKAASSSADAGQADAWIGNRMVQPNKGKAAVQVPESSQDHLFASTFKNGAPPDGCWSDLPPVGKRPLAPPSDAAGFVTAAQAMRTEDPLPQGTVLGTGKGQGKAAVADPYHHNSSSAHVDMYSVMTFKPLTDNEATRYQHAWNDAPQHRRKPVPGAAADKDSGSKQQLDWQPNRTGKYVPFGGIAQEHGMNINTIIQNSAAGRNPSNSQSRGVSRSATAAGANNSSNGARKSGRGANTRSNGTSTSGGKR
eukprot:GHRR01012818.1.p1 GENE.GHRR01012818.1~~GHRR01012818.1.p1  ORF type:complete len:258 (+),score=98.23 GHRR01012818.1:920-1693(+)